MNHDIVTPQGSIRFTNQGIVLESGGNKIEISYSGIKITSTNDVKMEASKQIVIKAPKVMGP